MQGMAWWHRGGYSTAAPTSVGHGSFGVRAWWCQWRDKSGRSWFFGFWERERREKNRGKNASSSPVLCASRGRSRLMVPFKTAPFALSLSFFSSEMHETTPFWPKRVISFKRKLAPKWVQFQISPSICALFHYGPWFWISSIKSLIGHQTSICMQLSPWFDQINS